MDELSELRAEMAGLRKDVRALLRLCIIFFAVVGGGISIAGIGVYILVAKLFFFGI